MAQAGFAPTSSTRCVPSWPNSNQAQTIEDMNITSFHLHSLKGNMKGLWSLAVRANWRIVFSFASGDADDVDLIDYH